MRVPGPTRLLVLLSVITSALALAQTPATNPAEAATPPTLYVAAASDLRFALEEIARLFEQQSGARVRLSFGSSGQLAAQIAQGAPFDVFFSADEEFVRTLARQGLLVPETVRRYAIGRIVLWVRTTSPLDVTKGLGVLLDRRVRFVAIANPQHAPYGRAAVEALRASGLYDRLRPRLVLGENISQALQWIQTGNADAGVVALSLAAAPPVREAGRYWLIPDALHRPIHQAAGVAARTSQSRLARAFVTFVIGPDGRPILRRYGFQLPGEAS